MMDQHLTYTHINPLKSALWKSLIIWTHSSAKDYSKAGKGRIDLLFLCRGRSETPQLVRMILVFGIAGHSNKKKAE
jgi:hypothetical protein